MDQLDRLFIELVEALREERPSALGEPLVISELHEALIPYRRVRDPGGFHSNGDYETALSRLISGERGYLISEVPEMQEDVRAGLQESFPDARRFLAYPDVPVWLNPEEIPPPGHIRYAPPELQEAAAQLARQTTGDSVGAVASSNQVRATRTVPLRKLHKKLHKVEPTPEPHVEESRRHESDDESSGSAESERCPDCTAVLPERSVNYCPQCGRRLTRALCHTCGEELEPAWQFCVECGTPRGPRAVNSA